MMKRRNFLIYGAAALALPAGAAFASVYGDEVVAQLTRQGFSNITVETTWLGRERILAERADGRREIILNPRTGEILRDTWTSQKGAAATRPIVDEVGDGGSSGGSGDHSGSDDHGSGGGSGDNSGSDDNGSGSGSSDGSSGGSGGGDDHGGDDKGGDKGGSHSGSDDSGDDKGDDK